MRGVTAIVVTFNSSAVVGDFLAALPAGFGPVPYELIVVDNDSRDDTVAIVGDRAPGATVIATGANLGYSGGVNVGVRHRTLTGPILILNPDVRLRPGLVSTLTNVLEEPGVGIAAPRIEAPDGTIQFSQRRDPTVLRAWGEAILGGPRAGRFARLGDMVTDPSSYDDPSRPDWVSGAIMLYSADCAQAVGPWDERFFLYSEETDFALRARASGYGIRFVPTASAVHIGGDANTSPALWSILVRNRVRLYRKYHGPWKTRAFASGVFANELIRAAAGRATSRAALRDLVRGVPPGPP
jgi:GT2 family glycosyltransferase